jgi:hypothetical protein
MVAIAAGGVGLSWDAHAAAGPESEDALIRRGLGLRKRGNDAAALPLLERAYTLAHSPRAAAQLGFAEQALGRWSAAELHVSEALWADHDHWVAKNRAVVSQALDTIRAHTQPPRRRLVLTAPTPRDEPVQPLLVQERAADPAHGQRVAGISVAAGGVAAIGLGVASSLVSKNKLDAINQDARADRPFNEANGNWKSYDRAAALLYVLGAGALVSGIVIYSTAPSPEQQRAGATPARSVALRPTMTSGRLGAALAMRF